MQEVELSPGQITHGCCDGLDSSRLRGSSNMSNEGEGGTENPGGRHDGVSMLRNQLIQLGRTL
jgi:hypothetical protein